MFRLRLNELRVSMRLAPTAPLLIKEGRHQWSDIPGGKPNKRRRFFHRGVYVDRVPIQSNRKDIKNRSYDSDEGCFDMAFVYSRTLDGDRFYVPGSSLRGVLRSAAERLVARWQPAWTRLSDPFTNAVQAYIERQPQRPSATAIHALSGPIDRCFGHTALRGRWIFADAWIANEPTVRPRMMVRDGVGINRKTGAAQDSLKYQFEAMVSGEREVAFSTTLTLVNYELWQLGMLAHLLAALDGGEIRLGYGTHRGLGRVRVYVDRLDFRWYLPHDGSSRIPALGALLRRAEGNENDLAAWGLHEDGLALELPLTRTDTTALWPDWRAALPASAQQDPWASAPWSEMGPLFGKALVDWAPPAELLGTNGEI